MNLSEEISKIRSIFVDTAPIIYYIEAHPLFGSFHPHPNPLPSRERGIGESIRGGLSLFLPPPFRGRIEVGAGRGKRVSFRYVLCVAISQNVNKALDRRAKEDRI